MNIQLSPEFIFGFSAMLTCVVIAFSRRVSLSFPVPAIIWNNSALPVRRIFSCKFYASMLMLAFFGAILSVALFYPRFIYPEFFSAIFAVDNSLVFIAISWIVFTLPSGVSAFRGTKMFSPFIFHVLIFFFAKLAGSFFSFTGVFYNGIFIPAGQRAKFIVRLRFWFFEFFLACLANQNNRHNKTSPTRDDRQNIFQKWEGSLSEMNFSSQLYGLTLSRN